MILQSLTGLDHITSTQGEELSPHRYVRPSHGCPLSEMELRHPATGGYTKHDKHLERIRIPSSNSVATKSGSVEIGRLVWGVCTKSESVEISWLAFGVATRCGLVNISWLDLDVEI